MKQNIKVTTNKKNGEQIIIQNEVQVRNLEHLAIQQNNRSNTFKPKKGKGSYTRKTKYKEY